MLKRTSFKNALLFNDLDYKTAFQRNQIYQNTASCLDFLAGKIGGTVISCCFDTFHPKVQFTEILKVGNKSTGKLYLNPPCDDYRRISKFKAKVNGQSLATKDSVSKFAKTFKDTSPQALNVEYEFHETLFKNHKFIIDTTFLREQFIIHPIKK